MYDEIVAGLGLVANIVMAGAAAWAVWAAREWRQEMRDKSMHELALDATIVANRIEQTWHDAMDRWSKLAPLGAKLLHEVNPAIATLYRLDAAIPELTAKMDALCGKGFAAPLQELHSLIEALTSAIAVDVEQRDRPEAAQAYEPYATTMRVQVGFHAPEAAKAWVADLVAVVSDWAAPYLGHSGDPGPKLPDIERRVSVVKSRRKASADGAATKQLAGAPGTAGIAGPPGPSD